MKRAQRAARAVAIATYVEWSPETRAALARAQETADDLEYARAIAKLTAAVPQALWIGHDADFWFVQQAAPIWITEDPAGEDPSKWKLVDRDEIVRSLVEDT
jgi:hypothetical protein